MAPHRIAPYRIAPYRIAIVAFGLWFGVCTLLAQAATRPDDATADTPASELAPGVFLVAGTSLLDPNFVQTVVLLINYSAQGAFGVIVNREIDVTLSTALPDIELSGHEENNLRFGGPVAPQNALALVRSDSPPSGSQPVFGQVHASGNLSAIAGSLREGNEDIALIVCVGYAGWAPGQLDAEYARGDWHVAPADDALIFDSQTDAIWPQLIRKFRGTWVKARGGATALR
ncbi:MAG: YqgE/AlgH family protein [Gammaproteobacteria bacterium]